MRKTYRWLSLGGALVLLGVAGILWVRGETAATPALAQAKVPPQRPVATAPAPPEASAADREARRFRRYDRDRDESVSRSEYLRSRRASFDRFDANGDGVLAFQEYAAKQIDRFEGADGDGSGALVPAEFEATRTRTYTRRAKASCKSA